MKMRRRPRFRTTRRAPLRCKRRTPMRRRRTRKLPPVIPDAPIGGSPPSYFELLQDAVLTLKQERRGVSLPEIRRIMLRNYKGRFDKASNDLLTTALERLAQRGKVIYKHGYKYRFNAPKVAKHKPKTSDSEINNATSASTYNATSGSATTGQTDATAMDSCTSASSASGSRSTRSTRSTKSTKSTKSSKRMSGQDEPEKAQQDAESPQNVEEEKSSAGDLSSSVAASGSSTSASHGSSRKRRR